MYYNCFNTSKKNSRKHNELFAVTKLENDILTKLSSVKVCTFDALLKSYMYIIVVTYSQNFSQITTVNGQVELSYTELKLLS